MAPELAMDDRALCADNGLAPVAAAGARPARDAAKAGPVPVTLLTGFLGSGKTTLLRRLLLRTELSDSAVIINEAGEVSIDHHLVQVCKKDIAVLPNGCLCCTVRSDLVDAMRNLLFNRGRNGVAAYRRVFIETTGLADPAPVLHALTKDPFVQRMFRLDGIITTVDASHGSMQLDRYRESVKQAAVADRIVLTKTDLAAPTTCATLAERLRRLNPSAPQITAVLGDLDPAEILNIGLATDAGNEPRLRQWLAADRYRALPSAKSFMARQASETHDSHVHSYVIRCSRPLMMARVQSAIHLLCGLVGENVLRVKALLDIEGQTGPIVLHAVQHVVYPPVTLDAWPDDDHRSAFVFVVRDLDPGYLRKILSLTLGEGAVHADTAPIITTGDTK